MARRAVRNSARAPYTAPLFASLKPISICFSVRPATADRFTSCGSHRYVIGSGTVRATLGETLDSVDGYRLRVDRDGPTASLSDTVAAASSWKTLAGRWNGNRCSAVLEEVICGSRTGGAGAGRRCIVRQDLAVDAKPSVSARSVVLQVARKTNATAVVSRRSICRSSSRKLSKARIRSAFNSSASTHPSSNDGIAIDGKKTIVMMSRRGDQIGGTSRSSGTAFSAWISNSAQAG